MEPLVLHPDRYFDPDPGVRAIARDLYESVAELPLVCPHGHVDPSLLADNEPWPEPTALIITSDHYVVRMLYSQGVPMEDMGIPPLDGSPAKADPDGSPVTADPRTVWRIFGECYHLFRGTPTRAWLDYELHEVFGIRTQLDGESALHVYDEMLEKLRSPEFLPRTLFDRFGIEVLTTTDGAADSLEHHRAIRDDSTWDGRVIPCFRPDAVFRVAAPGWPNEIGKLGRAAGMNIAHYGDFIDALERRRAFFREMGAVSTDHAVVEPVTRRLSDREAGALFEAGLRGRADDEDQRRFEAHVLMEMARMSLEDGLVMQLHAGSFRNHNQSVFDRFGPDQGGDIPVRTEFTRNLHELLNVYGNDARFRLILFTLDETTYSRELAPMAGHYPALRLGPPWWFYDSIEGMRRYRRLITETAGIGNTAGFNDDTRAFCSIPARHDLARRVDCDFTARLVAEHQIGLAEGREMVRAMAYDLVCESYRLDGS